MANLKTRRYRKERLQTYPDLAQLNMAASMLLEAGMISPEKRNRIGGRITKEVKRRNIK